LHLQEPLLATWSLDVAKSTYATAMSTPSSRFWLKGCRLVKSLLRPWTAACSPVAIELESPSPAILTALASCWSGNSYSSDELLASRLTSVIRSRDAMSMFCMFFEIREGGLFFLKYFKFSIAFFAPPPPPPQTLLTFMAVHLHFPCQKRSWS